MGPGAELEAQASWRATRLALIFMLDIVQTVRGSGHPIDPMILSVVAMASVSELDKHAQLERSYASAGSSLPDDLRRPITINAIANSTNLAFETVRRRVHRLADAGLLEITPRGVIQSAQATTAPAFLAQVTARYERVRRFYFELRAADCLPDLPVLDGPLPRYDEPPVRVASRAVGEFALRAMEELIGLTGHPLRGVMLLAVARATAQHLDIALFDEAAPLADECRRPVRTAEIARHMGLPAETTRRHMEALVRLGVLMRLERGYTVSAAGVTDERGQASAQRGAQNLRRLMVRLAESGVLAFWDAEEESSAWARRAAG